jgi:glycerol-3-phosphate O-acyltransferase
VRERDVVRAGPEASALAFLSELVRAYLEAYRLAAETALAVLAGPERVAGPERRALVREALERGRGGFLSGHIRLRESLSKATLENAVEWLVSQGVIEEEGGRLCVRDGGAALRAIVDGITPHFAV